MLLSITEKFFTPTGKKIRVPALVSALSFNAKSAMVVCITLSNETVVGSIKNSILWLCWVGGRRCGSLFDISRQITWLGSLVSPI